MNLSLKRKVYEPKPKKLEKFYEPVRRRTNLKSTEQDIQKATISLGTTKGYKPPSVCITSPELYSSSTKFSIDTEAQINLIKEKTIARNVKIDEQIIYELIAITKDKVYILG